MTKKHSSIQRIPEIDGLRAFAVLSVILFHLHHALVPGGFTGVDVFFVISGYVVCGSLLRDTPASFFPFIGAFYVRRIYRIYPALIAMLVLAGLLSTLFIPIAFLSLHNRTTGSWAFLGLSNIALVLLQNSYFSENNDYNPYAHTWSLGVEEQYYLVFPVVLFWILRSRAQGWAAQRPIFWLLPALGIVSLIWSMWETTTHHDAAYYLLPSRFWELALGSLLYLAHDQRRLIPASARPAGLLVTAGLALLVLSDIVVEPVHFPFPLALLPILGTALCIAGVAVPRGKNPGAKFLRQPLVVAIGKISYSLYLWHWVVLVFFRWTVGLQGLGIDLAALVLIFALGALSYAGVEVRTGAFLAIFQDHRKRALAAAAACILLAFLAYRSVTGGAAELLLSLSVVSRQNDIWYPNPGDGHGAPGRHWSGREVFCVGDSHAYAYGGMLGTLEKNDGVNVSIYSQPGRPVCSLVTAPDPAAEFWKRQILAQLAKNSHPGDVVLLAALRMDRLCEQWGPLSSEELAGNRADATEPHRRRALADGEDFLARLAPLHLHVVIDAPLPVFPAPPFRGSDWFNRMNPVVRPGYIVDRAFLLQRRAPVMQALRQVQARFPDLLVWDPLPAFGPGSELSAFEGNRPLFFDGDHLTNYGGQKLYPSFLALLHTIWD